jgi:alpha-amylase
LAERVWEPNLPTSLQQAGMQYVLIDDEAFHRQGMAARDTWTTYLTEDEGATVRLLPINRTLRYTLPTKPVAEIMAALRDMAAQGAEALIYAEDGERYGDWPGTYDYLYGDEAYLERLCCALETADDLVMTLPSELVAQTLPRGLTYVPPCSYTEMQGWSGGFWRNFLTRYRESNLMHKKMLQVSRWVAQAEATGADVRAAQLALYAGQCNCPYWFGVFGGIYFPHLRRAVYAALLAAERAVEPLLLPGERACCERVDFDGDGREEIFLREGELSLGIAPAQGGAVFALEHLGLGHNLLGTMSRYAPTGDQAADTSGMPVDWYPRFAFLDHFLAADDTPELLRDAQFREQGDCVLGAYTVLSAESGEVRLSRAGHVWDGPDFLPVQIEKRYRLTAEGVQLDYRLENRAARARVVRFAVEVHAALSAGDLPERRLLLRTAAGDEQTLALTETAARDGITGFSYQDDWLGVIFAVDWAGATPVWVAPIATPLHSIAGAESIYQSTVVLPVWELSLAPGEAWSVSLSMRVTGVGREALLLACSGG